MEEALKHLNIYGKNAPKPPYTKNYLREFRRQQISRSLRITKWCREQVKAGNRRGMLCARWYYGRPKVAGCYLRCK